MFCQKCGTQIAEGAGFCQKCGTKLTVDEVTQQTPVKPVSAVVQKNEPTKKKSKKIPIILTAVAVIIAIIIIAANWGGGIDYVASVNQWKPFRNSQGIDATIAQVVNKYISSLTWKEIKVGKDEASVTVKGKIMDDGELSDITLVFSVSPSATSDSLSFRIYSATLDGETISGNNATEFLLMMFDAYNEGFDNLDYYLY